MSSILHDIKIFSYLGKGYDLIWNQKSHLRIRCKANIVYYVVQAKADYSCMSVKLFKKKKRNKKIRKVDILIQTSVLKSSQVWALQKLGSNLGRTCKDL